MNRLYQLFSFSSDIPFHREEASRMLPYIIATIVCLIAVLLTVSISLNEASHRSSRLNVRNFQIYLPYAKGSDELNAQVQDLLSASEAVARVATLRKEQLAGLIEPWTGQSLSLEELPLPTVIEVTLADGVERQQTIALLAEQLRTLEPAIEIESYESWMTQLTRFTRMLRGGAWVLTALLTCGLMALMAMMMRTSLKLHFPAVRLLHTIGATDNYITRQFIANGCMMMLKGCLMGVGAASIIVVAASMLSIQLQSPLLPAIELGGWHIAMLFLMPLLLLLLTYGLVRITVSQWLEKIH